MTARGLTRPCATAPAGVVAVRDYRAPSNRVKGSPCGPASRPLTRLAVALSGDTGRPGRARSSPANDHAEGEP